MKSPDIRFTEIPSPIGKLTLVASPRGLMAIYMEEHTTPPGDRTQWHADPAPFTEVKRQLDSYFAGSLREFEIPLDLVGTPFQKAAWQALQKIPYGETRSYAQQATLCGKPKAVRAIGTANGRNPISIIVPCHRVIGKDGSLIGYGGGLERKRFLLELENSSCRSSSPPAT